MSSQQGWRRVQNLEWSWSWSWMGEGGAGDSAHRLPLSRPYGGGDAATTCGWPAPRLSALSQSQVNGIDDQ